MKRDLKSRVHHVGPGQLEWPFRGDPFFKTKGPVSYFRSHTIDPFPCYAHDADLVVSVVEMVEERFPIGYQVDYFVSEYEDLGRTNGYATKTDVYGDKKEGAAAWEPVIIFMGKRIPPHPAMTKYLVAHEYGHVAKWWIEKMRGIDGNKETTDLDREYMSIRPGSTKEYGGKKWHENVGELMANDCRILVCGVEKEFWPHPGFQRPEDIPEVRDFWEKVVVEAMKLEFEHVEK